MARRTFVSKSPVPIFGLRRTSLKVTERCFRLASFSRFVSSYLYCPKSRNLTTGGAAIGATSTRSRPRSCAIARACGVGMTPSWAPSSSTTRTWGIRIIWLTRRSRLMVVPFELVRTLRDRSRGHGDPSGVASREDSTGPPRRAIRGASPRLRRPPRGIPRGLESGRARADLPRRRAGRPARPRARASCCSPRAAARDRGATVRASTSRSPRTSMYGTFCSWASRILFCIRLSESSTSTRRPAGAEDGRPAPRPPGRGDRRSARPPPGPARPTAGGPRRSAR